MSQSISSELAALRDLFHTCDPVPGSMVAAAYRAPGIARGWQGAGALELIGDSADAPPSAKTRSGRIEPRVLTFATPGRIIEMDLTSTTPGALRACGMVISRAGQGVPCGDVVVRHPDGVCSGPLDEHGAFRVEEIPSGPLSVVFRPYRATPAVADWFVC
jgi:hypothetical protein